MYRSSRCSTIKFIEHLLGADWNKSGLSDPSDLSDKRPAVNANSVGPRRHIIIPDIRTEQFSEDVKKAKHTQVRSDGNKKDIPDSPFTEKRSSKPTDWRSQTAFELSSSMESEASFIVSEFLQKTTNCSNSELKLESYV